jgi:peptidoglycan-N-acetylglucosamine deacetylase
MKNAFVTTSWDDGHVLDMKLAGLLAKYNIKGTFYISLKNREFERKELLTADQIRLLSKYFEIGAHTLTHPRLSKISEFESKKEIEISKLYLEIITGKAVLSFCYPGGSYNLLHTKQVADAGYKFARTTKRFETKTNGKIYETATTVHAYRHWTDLIPIIKLSRFNLKKFIEYYFNWDKLAIDLFDKSVTEGGVFHLWGHSWEIEKNHDWQRLTNVFEHLKSSGNVTYVENRQIYE